jgi:hypothetical protein
MMLNRKKEVGLILALISTLIQAGATVLPSSAFALVQDVNNTTFFIGRLETQDHEIESCYEVRQKLDVDGFTFCYPAISISGFGGCATSELEQFMSTQPFIATDGAVSNCLEPAMSLFEHFESFAKLRASDGKVHVNTCLWPSNMQTRVMQVLNSHTAHVYVVCNPPNRAWNLYNMFCDRMYDTDCTLDTTLDMYRSPLMFDQLLRRQEFPLAVKSFVHPELQVPIAPSCAAFEKMYSQHTVEVARVTGRHALILASETLLRIHPLFSAQMRRLEAYLVDILGQKWTLETSKFPSTATVSAAAGNAQIQLSREGKYSVSHFRSPLPATVQLIMNCWKECHHISHVTGYAYNCSSTTTA